MDIETIHTFQGKEADPAILVSVKYSWGITSKFPKDILGKKVEEPSMFHRQAKQRRFFYEHSPETGISPGVHCRESLNGKLTSTCPYQ